ncbi:hypothetical protein AB0L06_41680 [Spirillospora sp. NPDC052269]
MSGFFQELAKQLATRWMSLLALPGILFMAACLTASWLGQARALDVHLLSHSVDGLGAELSRSPGATQALLLTAALLGSGAIGLAVQALCGPVQALCLGQWPRGLSGLAGRLTDRRRSRWHELLELRRDLERGAPAATRTSAQQRRIDQVGGQINALARAEPGRPTWMGDRIHALGQVSVYRYGLDLEFGWSRLWLALPDEARKVIDEAQAAFAGAVYILAWSVPYLVLAAWWWPSAVVSLVIAVAARQRCRAAIDTLTDLTEAVLDTHGRDLAIALAAAPSDSTGPLTIEEGRAVTRIVRKGR